MLRVIRLTICLLIVPFTAPAQTALGEQDIARVITFYKDFRPENLKLPSPVTDLGFRARIHKQLPPYKRINDDKLVNRVSEVLRPVLSFYRRATVYDVLLVDSPTSFMMSDSGVVLVISNEMIKRAESDDELLGYAAHEVAHEYFVQYSVYTKYLLGLITNRADEPALRYHVLQILALIELQCDAIAALTLNSLGYNSTEFIRGIEKTQPRAPNQIGNHPPDYQRRSVVEELAPGNVTPRQSEAFKDLKRIVGCKERAANRIWVRGSPMK